MTGVALTKLDGSAKGGIAVAIAHELGLPVKLIGIGESLDDLRPFDPERLRPRPRRQRLAHLCACAPPEENATKLLTA